MAIITIVDTEIQTVNFEDLDTGDLFFNDDPSSEILHIKTDENDWNACSLGGIMLNFEADEQVRPFRGVVRLDTRE